MTICRVSSIHMVLGHCASTVYLARHPRRHPVGAELGSESQTGRAHGKVANEIPDEREELYDTEKQR